MGIKRKKLLLIGIDQAILYLIKKFYNEGVTPNIGHLIENGVMGEAYSCPPCDTPTNWATIATGATTATHGVTSFYMHLPKEPLDLGLKYRSRTQLSRYCNAEYLWDVADKNNFIPFVMNYPGGWPSYFRKGVMSLFTWAISDSLPIMIIPSAVINYNSDSNSTKRLHTLDKNVKNIKSYSPILQAQLKFKGKEIINPVTFNFNLFDSNGKGYDSLRISAISKQNIKESQWSNWLPIELETNYGKLECIFKLKVLKIDPKGRFVKLKHSGIYNIKGWTTSDSFSKKLIKNVFEYDLPEKKEVEFMIYDKLSRFLKNARNESLTLAKSIAFAKKHLKWDFCYFHYHQLDTINHDSLAYMYKDSPVYSEETYEKTLKNVRIAYKIVDEMVGLLNKYCVDDETIVVFISDHGAVPIWKIVNIPLAFKDANLLDYKWDNVKKKYVINWKKTLAFPYMEPPFIWINLKERELNGLVPKSEYEIIRDRVIETLYKIRDPQTNESIIQLAVKKEEAINLGLNGDRVGDIIYFLKPPYGIFDGNLGVLNASELTKKLLDKPLAYDAKTFFGAHAYYLPNTKFGNFTVKAPLIIAGPDIQNGIELKKTVDLTDIAPTLAHLLEIPKPKNAEGKILYDLMK